MMSVRLSFLRPHFFTREKYEEITHAAEVLASAFERLTLAALDDEKLLPNLI